MFALPPPPSNTSYTPVLLPPLPFLQPPCTPSLSMHIPLTPPPSISGRMTAALSLYSAVFMRYSMAVTPANYLLFGCHAINFTSQLTQGYRYLQYWNWGGREIALKAKEAAGEGAGKVEKAIKSVGK